MLNCVKLVKLLLLFSRPSAGSKLVYNLWYSRILHLLFDPKNCYNN